MGSWQGSPGAWGCMLRSAAPLGPGATSKVLKAFTPNGLAKKGQIPASTHTLSSFSGGKPWSHQTLEELLAAHSSRFFRPRGRGCPGGTRRAAWPQRARGAEPQLEPQAGASPAGLLLWGHPLGRGLLPRAPQDTGDGGGDGQPAAPRSGAMSAALVFPFLLSQFLHVSRPPCRKDGARKREAAFM